VRIARRAERIEPFYVMEVAKAATKIAREVAHSDRPMIFLNIGEPDFTAPPLVREAAERAIRDGRTQYTDAMGLDALRERISGWYAERFGVNVPARRIVVTAGASAALQLACLALIEAGDEILMPDPSYPSIRTNCAGSIPSCNRRAASRCSTRSTWASRTKPPSATRRWRSTTRS
jgi:aspartate/methionine/tyrosine aminotransferase